jgi:large subunit ribosomal protein L13e
LICLFSNIYSSSPSFFSLSSAPRPVGFLRPSVRGQTLKYKTKVRFGRGFSLSELKEAKVNKHEARGLGIAIDYRRRNLSKEGQDINTKRLKAYLSKLVLFPRKASSKRIRKGEATKEQRKAAFTTLSVFPATQHIASSSVAPRKITKDELQENVVAKLRKERTDALLWGRREKRVKDKAAAAAAGKKKGDDVDAE